MKDELRAARSAMALLDSTRRGRNANAPVLEELCRLVNDRLSYGRWFD